MARSRELKVVIAGDADKLERELRKSSGALDKLGKQTRLTGTMSSKGFAAMRVGAVGATAALGGLALVGKKVVDAAIEAEKSQAKLAAQLKASGISYRANAKEIDAVISKHSQLAGVDDEELTDAFTAIVRTTGSVNTAMRDMGLVTDIARAKNIDVAKAGDIVAKVHAGQYKGLKTLNLEFVKTTANVDKLKASDDKITPAELAAAKAADVRANSTRALGLIQDKVRGQAEAYGKTTAGSVDRAKVAFENLEDEVGGALAPTVEKAANKLADFVNEMQDGTGQGGKFVDTLKDIWGEVQPIVTWIGRATKNVAEFASEHPKVAKLAGAIIGVGLALKGLRFLSAATGFSSILKAGGVAARGLKRVLASGGTAAGEAAAANAASSFSNKGGRFSNAGRAAGRVAGRAMGAAVIVGLFSQRDQISAALDDVLGRNSKSVRGRTTGDTGGSTFGIIGDALGSLVGKAAGGIIPGQGNGDTVPAMLTPGEFVIRKQVVQKYGPTFFANLNGGMGAPQSGVQRFAVGGKVRGLKPAFMDALRSLSSQSGKDITVTSGLRTSAEQTALWNASDKSGKWVARPGTSKHESGNAADIAPQRGAFSGAQLSGSGLYFPMSWEPWHIQHRGGGSGSGGGSAPRRLTGAALAADAAYRAGFRGSNLTTMVAIAGRESRYNPGATNLKYPDHSIGLWQINQLAHKGRYGTDRQLMDPYVNARAAFALYKQAGLSPWKATRALSRGQVAAAGKVVSRVGRLRASGTLGEFGGDSPSSADVAEQASKAGSRIVNALTGKFGPGIDKALKVAGATGALMERAETKYGQTERRFGQSEEDLGTSDGRTKRTDELKALKQEKGKQLARAQRRASHLKTGLARLDKLIAATRKKRDGTKGNVRARIVKRIKDFEDKRTDLAAELAAIQGETIPDLQLDIGDLDKDIAEVAGTEDTGADEAREAAKPENRISAALGDIDLQERAGILSPADANAARQGVLQRALNNEFGGLDQRQQWALMGDLRDAQQAATDAQKAATESADAQTQALRDLKASIDASNAIANSTLGISAREATRAFADVISGQLGQNAGMRGTMPGTGALASVGNSRY